MKKRLFISSILMTLVLLVAITTATFAWYQVTNNAALGKSATDGATIASSVSTKNIGNLDFDLEVEIAQIGNSRNASATSLPGGKLEMVTYIDNSGTPKAQFGYYVGNEASPRFEDNQFSGTEAYWVVYSVTVSLKNSYEINNVTYTAAEALALLQNTNQTYTLTVNADAAFSAVATPTQDQVTAYNAKYGTSYTTSDTLPAVAASRAKIYAISMDGSNPVVAGPAVIDATGSLVLTGENPYAIGETTKTYYFGLYVEGTGSDGTAEAAHAPNGNFTVSLS